jgi:hypothetical protein
MVGHRVLLKVRLVGVSVPSPPMSRGSARGAHHVRLSLTPSPLGRAAHPGMVDRSTV